MMTRMLLVMINPMPKARVRGCGSGSSPNRLAEASRSTFSQTEEPATGGGFLSVGRGENSSVGADHRPP